MATSQNPDRLLDLASQLQRAGRFGEAADVYVRLLQLKPDLPDSWYNLGYVLQHLRRSEAALNAYREALDRRVQQPEEAHLARALIYADQLARTDDAETELNIALRLNPGYFPALLNLGNIHEQRGQREQAVEAYEKALAVDPASALALARLSMVKTVRDADDPLIARLRSTIGRPGATPAERADLGFALGKALDDAGAYDEAFAAYGAANRDSRLSAGPNGVRYDPLAYEQFIDRIIRTFPGPSSDAPAASSGASQRIFVCGMFRSGSTLVEQMLARHPRVTSGGELPLLPRLVHEQLRAFDGSAPPIDARMLQRLRTLYQDGAAALFPGADVLTDKRPDNFLCIGLIKAMFPDAKIVHTRRDPLDNGLSLYFLHLSHAMPYALDLRDIGHWYRQYRRLMAHWKAIYGEQIHDVDYDPLVADPAPVARRLLDHCGLAWDDACLTPYRTDGVVRTASVWQVRQPIYTRSSGRWRHYSRHLDPLRAALAEAD
ncbi:MAG: sulfotransferase [Proteobacteria bacterium]|nr:sulfotransferase [Pseudomonadota bacterium]